jgi:hypothetical protein
VVIGLPPEGDVGVGLGVLVEVDRVVGVEVGVGMKVVGGRVEVGTGVELGLGEVLLPPCVMLVMVCGDIGEMSKERKTTRAVP